jgi:hypothetical protein
MTEREIHIEQLMLEQLTGVISGEDALYLEDLLQNDDGIRLQWEEFNRSFEKKGHSGFLGNIDAEKAWGCIRKGIADKRRSRIVKIRKLMIAASLIIPLLIAGVFFYRSGTAPDLSLVQPPDSSVKLYVGGSHPINLSQYNTPSNFSVLSNIRLQVSKGKMTYTPLNNRVDHALNTLMVPATATYRITLSDGTDVLLNSMSQLKFPFAFSGGTREVWLKGEAYFRVARDARHPFIVHTPMTQINVLGTEFNVDTYDSLRVKTALINGKVSTLAVNGKSITLKPGYESVFSPEKGFAVNPFDRSTELSWMQGIYYFQNASLQNIAAVVYRWYGETMLFDDVKSSSSRFTGAMLKSEPLKEFLDNMESTSNIRYYERNDAIHISAH